MSTRYFLCKAFCYLNCNSFHYSFLKGNLFELIEENNICRLLLLFKNDVSSTFFTSKCVDDFFSLVEKGYFEELSEDEVRIKDIIE